MNRAQKYFFNGILLSCATIAMRGIAVSFNAFVTLKIGSEAVGLFTLVMSVYTLAITLATSGVNLAAVRMTAECLAIGTSVGLSQGYLKKALRNEMWGCIRYSLFFGFFAQALLFLLSDIVGIYLLCDERTIPSLKVLSIALPAISLSSALGGYFTGLRKIHKNALISIGEQFVKISVTTVALITIAPKGIEYACLSVVGGSAIAEGASLLFSFLLYLFDKNKADGNLERLPSNRKSAFSRAFDIAFPVAAGSYVRQGLLCAEHIAIPAGLRRYGAQGRDALSSYGALHAMAFPLIFFPSSVIGAFASLLIPELSEYNALGQTEAVKRISKKVISFSLLFSIGCGGMFLAFGHDLGMAIYKSDEVGPYICAFAPLVPIMYLDTAVDSVLKGLGQQVYCMKVNIIDATVSLILVLILVPIFGTTGYIICVWAAELLNFALSITKMLSVTRIRFSPSWIISPLFAILASATAVRFFTLHYPLLDTAFFKILLTALIYSVLIIPKRRYFHKKSYKTEKELKTT